MARFPFLERNDFFFFWTFERLYERPVGIIADMCSHECVMRMYNPQVENLKNISVIIKQ